MIAYAFTIRIRALARLGELLKQVEKQAGDRGRRGPGTKGKRGSHAAPHIGGPPTLKDLGIDKKTSSVAQQFWALPAKTREAIAQRETTIAKVKRAEKKAASKRGLSRTRADWSALALCG